MIFESQAREGVPIDCIKEIIFFIPWVRLTMASKYAIVIECGGDDPRAEFGRMTSTGGSSAGSQLRNRPLTVGLF